MNSQHVRVYPFLLFLSLLIFSQTSNAAPPMEHDIDAISGGAEALDHRLNYGAVDPVGGSPDGSLKLFTPGAGFQAYNFDDNGTETGFYFIPPDPIGAAGLNSVIAVVNVGIECRTKSGSLIFRDSLKDLFAPLGAQTLGTFTFDPKIVYDHYENRFVIVTLERLRIASGDPVDDSRILVAVSKTSSPVTATAADWWYLAIDSKLNIDGTDHWADYPGFEIDEEAIYITNNMYTFAGYYGEPRLWIIEKGPLSGFYVGGAANWNVYDPVNGSLFDVTLQPALVHGAGGAGAGIGTYLVGYSGITFAGPGALELVEVIRIDNPLTTPTFTGQFVEVGDLEDIGGVFAYPEIPDAPQNGIAALIEVNDRRVLDAVWRNNDLWVTTTINPAAGVDPVNTGQATAHWIKLDTSAPGSITLSDHGNIGGEDIAPETWTFFPSVAVNGAGGVQFGFAASAASIYCGAYHAGREPIDPSGSVQASGVVQAGLAPYLRTFGTTRNRWGDYSGAAVDPIDDTTFWIFNQYAELQGTEISGEVGRWGTAWRQCYSDVAMDWGDAPDQPYPTLLASDGARHVMVPGIFMGTYVDGEPDGLPQANAYGDDLDNVDDEDGLVSMSLLDPGHEASVTISVTSDGFLDAWIDFDNDGYWDMQEQVFTSEPLSRGVNTVYFPCPGTGMPAFSTFSRFRFSSAGGLSPIGEAPDGEVEDYEVNVLEDRVSGIGQLSVPAQYALHRAYPNPFNPSTIISFSLPRPSHVRLRIFDVTGRLVRTLVDEIRDAARHEIAWNGLDDRQEGVASGVYIYRIETDSFKASERMVLMK
jgi:GEVED domain